MSWNHFFKGIIAKTINLNLPRYIIVGKTNLACYWKRVTLPMTLNWSSGKIDSIYIHNENMAKSK